MKLERFKPFLLGLGVIAGSVAIVLALGAFKPKTEKEETEKPPLVVRTAGAELKEQTVFATFQGEVRAKTNIDLVTQVTGKVMSVSDAFIEGGQFEAGEVLLQIDDADYLVALKSAEASVASAQVDLEVEQATAANRAREWRDLQGKPIEQANPLLLNKPQIDRAKARLDAAKAELAAAKLNYDRTRISAPFAGRIMSKSAELGQFMSRGGSVGRVFATDAMEVRIPMTDVQVSELGLRLGYSAQKDGSAGLPAKVSAIFGDEERVWAGAVRSVDASIDNQTRLLFATVVVDQPFAQAGKEGVPLVPGLFVDVELASPQKLTGLELPRTALRNGNQVYAYNNDELKLKQVKVIYTSEDKIIVAQNSSAVDVGELIITSSVPGAYEGMPIKLMASQTAGQSNEEITEKSAQESTEELVKTSTTESIAEPNADSTSAPVNNNITPAQFEVATPEDGDAEAEHEPLPQVSEVKDTDTGLSEKQRDVELAASKS